MSRRTTVTITDVAREAGVALGSVSNAFNHPDKMRPETLKRIREAADRLGYAPNQSARMLAGGKNRLFGLILPNLDHGVSLQIANGANAEARKHGYGLLIATAQTDEDVAHRYRDYFIGTQTAGILMQPPASTDWQPPVHPPRIPLAFLDIQCDVPGHFVAADNFALGELLARHAFKSGARRVAIIGKPSLNRLVLRVKGMKHAFTTESDCAFEAVEEGAWNSAHDGLDLGRRLAERPEDTRPDFIIALTDTLATGAISGVRAAGLRVPGDIRVAGCDGNPLAWTGPVPLTTIAPIGYELGRRGVRQLIAQIEEEPEHEPENHQELVRPFLLARASTGMNRSDDFADPDIDISGYL